jgi:DNA-binding transcriptional ArsR family regulator
LQEEARPGNIQPDGSTILRAGDPAKALAQLRAGLNRFQPGEGTGMSARRGKAREEEQLSRVFHALADPARRRIIALLRESGELPVGVVGKAFAMTLNGVSKHVKVLEAAGLVRRRIEGRVHWISVDWTALQIAYEFLHAHHHFWSTRLDALADYTTSERRARKRKRS